MTTAHDTAPANRHEHHHDADFDWSAQLTRLQLGGELHLPVFEQAAAWLHELRGAARTSRILDVGSGAGIATEVLARTFPEAEVVAVDATPALLDAVASHAERAGFADRVRVHFASLPEDAASLPEADLIWISDALHHLGDQQAAIGLLQEHLRPGGLLAVCEGGLPARFLPNDIGLGRPGLQARLDAALADGFAAMRSALPNFTAAVDDWPAMLRTSGLESVATRSFLVDAPSPASSATRGYLVANLTGYRDRLGEHLDRTDQETIARLVDAEDPGGLMRRSDVFYLSARTVHTGRRPSK